MTVSGKIYLVGAGPGASDLLTVKALSLIQQADTIVYDRLVSQEILELIPGGVARIYVGKTTNQHTFSQGEINALLVRLGRKREKVVRLKGGDPYVFGRGGEEALALARADIPFEVVPGITAAQGCAAYTGIPLTHRGMAQGVKFITGHFRDNNKLEVEASILADRKQTLVVYMGLANIALIAIGLIDAGRSLSTPVAIVENGTTPRQRTTLTTIRDLPSAVSEHSIESPALVIIGNVVSLESELNWFMPCAQQAAAQCA